MSPILRGPSQPDVGVIIPAGGRGVRAGAGIPKQFRSIAGVPMLLYSIRAFTSVPRVHEVVVPLPEEFLEAPPDWLANELDDRVRIVAGGDTRTLSVLNGVHDLSSQSTLVLVHDGARPFVGRETIAQIIQRISTGTCAIAAAPVSDTLKRSGDDGTVVETISRDGLWQAHTPQGFPRDILAQSYRALADVADTADVTDEASLVERAGFKVALVEDSTKNFKITTSDDFAIAEALLGA